MSSNSASEDWGKRAENTPFKGMGEQISKLVGQSPVESTTPDTPKTVQEILKQYRADIWEEASGQCQFQDTLDTKQTVEAINALRRADEARWSEDIFNRAKAGEVVKIERDGITYHLSTFEGMVDGQQRVVDAALTLGVEIGRHKRKERLNG